VDAVDGVSIAMSHDVGRTPTALPVYCERIGDLSGDPAADQGRFAELARECRQPAEGEISAALKAHLLPDTGPKAREAGGEWLMQIRLAHSMSRTAGLKEQIAAGQARPHGAAAEAEDEDGGEGFAAKLRLVLKLLTLSSAQLASALEIHKSVVSRWLSGGVEPSAHNLGRLTALIASRAPGFSALDWERSLEGLAQMFGADPASYPAPRRKAAKVMPLIIWDQMLATAERRGSAYEGFFRTTRPSLSEIGGFIHEYGIIQPHPSGLPRFRLASFGSFLDGWMIPLHDQLYCITADVTNGVLMFGVFNGVGAARVDVVDGLVLSPSPDAGRSPTAVPLISEHVEDLTGDPEADEARFAELSALKRFVDVDAVPQALRDRLLRDVGPKAFAEGGALVLQMPLAGSLARARGVKAAG
jgi:transcriptional regulator with XRE-family HTH domain